MSTQKFMCRFVIDGRLISTVIDAEDIQSAKYLIESQYDNGRKRFSWSVLPMLWS